MKKSLIIILSFLLISSKEEKGLPSIDNSSFQTGEKLRYRITYGIVDAGEATLEVRKTKRLVRGREMYHIVGKGKTAPFFDFFFKVRDTYETYLDTLKIRPINFLRDIYEGGYEKKQQYIFKHSDGLVFWEDTSHLIFPISLEQYLTEEF